MLKNKREMREEHSILSSVALGVLIPLYDFYKPFVWFLLLGLALIVIDYRFGTRASKKKQKDWKEQNPGKKTPEVLKFRRSRAWRRTGNKIVDYLCWITVAGLTGKAIEGRYNVPYIDLLVPLVIIAVIYRIEYTSAINNYFYIKGIKKKVKLFGFLDKNKGIIEEVELKTEEDE